MSPHADPRRRPRQPHPGSGPGSSTSHPPQASPGSPPRPGLPRSLARRLYRRRYRPAPRTSHDQNFKDLILDYPQAALAFFAAEEGITLYDEIDITFIRQEPPRRRLRDRALILDTPMRVHWRNGEREDAIFLFEEESVTRHFNIARMNRYTATVIHTQKTCHVYPVGIFLRRGTIEERLIVEGRHRRYQDFTFLPCRLAEMQAADFANSPNIVARITSVCMARPADSPSRVRVYGQAVKGLLTLERNPDLRQKYLDFIETYLTLTAEEWRLYEQLYPTENRKMGAFTQRWLEQGRQEGIRQGVQQGILQGRESGLKEGREEGIQLGAEHTQRRVLTKLLVSRFGPLDTATERRLQQASLEQMDRWTDQALTAQRLDEVFRLQ